MNYLALKQSPNHSLTFASSARRASGLRGGLVPKRLQIVDISGGDGERQIKARARSRAFMVMLL
ncbi:hypothetical protein BDZ89DRAFT_1067138 [Hymenopellis radicata]|nr:hypothetical protein BDZ89DRAFT_1067138 [Hymenopellis radicata]